jgi:hypothetical protein
MYMYLETLFIFKKVIKISINGTLQHFLYSFYFYLFSCNQCTGKKQIKSKKGTYFCETDTLRIGECPSNSPFLKNNGAETPKEPRPFLWVFFVYCIFRSGHIISLFSWPTTVFVVNYSITLLKFGFKSGKYRTSVIEIAL